MDIQSLLRKIKQGDKEAFQILVRCYQQKVFQLAYSYLRNKEDAMDIVQEAFLRLHQKLDLFREEKNFQNWLLQITRNICIDYYRKSYGKRGGRYVHGTIDAANIADDSDYERTYSADLKRIISECIDKLSERQRMVFVMKHFNHLDYKEIAQILDIALGTVKSLHFKAVQNMKALISPKLGERYE
ncbi:MAG: RNA polymerase sigma factor [Candidatus Aminicenantes bacterium]|nr:RNA polymerase sigma factor [Candidatus Aminicenantes bacterium]